MARSADDPRLCFKSLYHDELSGLTKEFQLCFYFLDKSVELTDLGTRKVFLKRTNCPNLDTNDFVLGKTVVVFGRLLHLTEYMDTVTRQLCEGAASKRQVQLSSGPNATQPSYAAASSPMHQQQQCGACYVFLERSKYFTMIGKALSVLDVELGFTVTGITAGTLPTVAVTAALRDANASPHTIASVEGNEIGQLRTLAGKMLCCFRLAKANANASIAEIYRRLAPIAYTSGGPLPPPSLTGLYAVATPTTTSPIESLFDAISSRSAAKYAHGIAGTGSVVIIKPHLLVRKAAGDVLQVLLEQSGGELVGLSQINLSSRDATSMLAAYRGVLPDFQGTTNQLSSGAAIAVHICSKETAAVLAAEDAYRDRSMGTEGHDDAELHFNASEGADQNIFLAVRALCGPYDPTIAKALRSATIRARYGVDRSRNAVHCCDIEEDVPSVCKFIFSFVAVRKLMEPSSECS